MQSALEQPARRGRGRPRKPPLFIPPPDAPEAVKATPAPRDGLSPKQLDCLHTIQALMAENAGASPSTVEVATRMDVKPYTAQRLMRALCDRGYARWRRYGHRALMLLPEA